MSVYTSISDHEFSEILKLYSLGDFTSAQGIEAGVENTNYFVTTTKGKFVFTLFEKINEPELKLYLSLLQELSKAGIACPQPQTNNTHTTGHIKGKPFVIVSCLKGKNLTSVTASHCQAIATELAKLHITNLSITPSPGTALENRRGKVWRENTAEYLLNQLPTNDSQLLSEEITFQKTFDDSVLPKGIIHADLFKDNALFENDKLSGIIDFYDACYDAYLYDVAITANAWCTNKNGELVESLIAPFLQSYQAIRPLTLAEKKAWPAMLRIAAMRFWLSRLEDSLTQREGDLTHRKNPEEYQQILQNHILAHPDNYAPLLNCG